MNAATAAGQHPLSVREREVLRLIAAGATKQSAADHLGVSRSTVNAHVSRAHDVLGVDSAAEAVAHAARRRLITLPSAPAKPADLARLSRRERDLLPLLAAGYTNREIAGRWRVAENTVKTHVYRLLKRIGARSRAHAVGLAIGSGWLVWVAERGCWLVAP